MLTSERVLPAPKDRLPDCMLNDPDSDRLKEVGKLTPNVLLMTRVAGPPEAGNSDAVAVCADKVLL